MKRTAGPWYYQGGTDVYTHIIRGPKGEYIGSTIQSSLPHNEANARYIVTACNHFEEMVEALKMVTGHADAFECFRDDIGQAVKKQIDDLLARIRKEMED